METGGQKYIMTKKNDIFSGFGQATTDGDTAGHTITITTITTTATTIYSVTNTTPLTAATGTVEGGVEEEVEGDVLDMIETIDINNTNSTSTPVPATSTPTAAATNNNTREEKRSTDESESNIAASIVNKSEDADKPLRSIEDIWHNIKVSETLTV